MKKQTFKVVLLGEGRVGKTSLVLRYVKNEFSDGQQSTIQATYLQKDLKINEQNVSLSIWDTAGQEKFHALGPIYYRDADGALLVYDITDQDSFTRVQNWIKELRKVVGSNIVLTIAGNKCDLKNRQVDQKEAEEYAAKVGGSHILTSAKANKGVDDAFLDLGKRILEQRAAESSAKFNRRQPSRGVISLDDTRTPPPRAGGIRVRADDEEAAPTKQGGCCG